MGTLADRILSFYKTIDYKGSLPSGVSIMNPFKDNSEIIPVITQFYKRFYSDNNLRSLILGINPGRFGAGVTGVPFTDTKRLNENCGISIPGIETYETSSVFVYEMIEKYGGPEKFYSDFYISSVCPLGFTASGKKGKDVNYNYYDSRELSGAVYEFIVESIRNQIAFGIRNEICFCLGTGKNFAFLSDLNRKMHFFDTVIPLEHPRFVMQYKSKLKKYYIDKYVNEFRKFK